MTRSVLAVALMLGMAGAATAAFSSAPVTVSGAVRLDASRDAPIPYAYIEIMTPSFEMAGQGASDASGVFQIELPQAVETGYVVVQPPAREVSGGIGAYRAEPRIYQYGGEDRLELRLPPAGCIVLRAYDENGGLMRWSDFRARGTLGGQFMYLTDLDDCAVAAVAWPVFDRVARDQGQPRDLGLPALVTRPGRGYVPQVLFWDVPGYGRLLLRTDNGGEGFSVSEAGALCVVDLNVELARTAVHDMARSPALGPQTPELAELERRLAEVMSVDDPVERAAAADRVLADALKTRDRLEVAAAQAAIPRIRRGTVRVTVNDGQGNPLPGCTVRATQQTSDFLFGVFEGSPYNASAFRLARKAGFNLATVLLAWGWTDGLERPDGLQAIEKTFGIGALNALEYTVKAHGVIWLQGYGILPERSQSMTPLQLHDAVLAHERALLDAFGHRVHIWEAMNEPNVTNVVNLPRPLVADTLKQSARQIADHGELLSLVNGAHEGDYGGRFALYSLDNAPLHNWNRTYSEYLAEAANEGVLEDIEIIGLQYYPGFHFNESFGGLQGPAMTPAWLVDTIRRYAEFNRPIHITECSIPSSYEAGWTSGYWREPWDEATQADYAEMVFILAFGHPAVRSISWWDVTDAKPSVVSGGLVDKAGNPKPAFYRIQALLNQWTRDEMEGKTSAAGTLELTGYRGNYEIEVTLPGGEAMHEKVHIREQESVSLVCTAGEGP